MKYGNAWFIKTLLCQKNYFVAQKMKKIKVLNIFMIRNVKENYIYGNIMIIILLYAAYAMPLIFMKNLSGHALYAI
jgi:hypothetical protein